jgi:hypothetical protein
MHKLVRREIRQESYPSMEHRCATPLLLLGKVLRRVCLRCVRTLDGDKFKPFLLQSVLPRQSLLILSLDSLFPHAAQAVLNYALTSIERISGRVQVQCTSG